MGVHPLTPAGEVDLRRTVRRAKLLLEANKERVEQTTTGNLRRGEQTWVYRRERKPCRRCGTPILVDQLGDVGRERATYWCPTCQR
jgi:endonuclease-8